MTRPYVSGHCAVGRHEACAGKYGAPGPEATCSCPHHAPADTQVDAAFAMVRTTCHNLIDNHRSIKAGFRRHIGPDFIAKLHAVYGDIWDVPLDKPIEVPR